MLTNGGIIFSFSSRNNAVESNRVAYPTSRYRYLRVRVQRDELNDNEAPGDNGSKGPDGRARTGPILDVERGGAVLSIGAKQGAHASVWSIDLGAHAPCDRLKLQCC